MSITLEPPSQLFFERPLTVSASETLTLTNTGNEPVAFKVKTTSPKQYCVRPNSGKIEPGEKVEVQILLQPFKEEPPNDFKCKDKFLVQTAIVPPEKVDLPTSQLWQSLEQENKSSIKERKLRCVFLPPNDEGNTSKQSEAAISPGNSLSEIPVYNTAREVPRIKRQPEDLKNLLADNLTRPNANSTATSKETPLKEDLNQANLTISRLEKDIEMYKAKLKTAESKSDPQSPMAVRTTPNNDFNIQAIGSVAVIAFLLGCWLF